MSLTVSQSLPPVLSRYFDVQIHKRERVIEIARFCVQNSHDFSSFIRALIETVDYLESEKISPTLQEYFHQGLAGLENKEVTYDAFCHGMLELFSERIKGRDLNLIFVGIEQYLSIRVAPYMQELIQIIESEKGRMQIDEESASKKASDLRMVQTTLLRLIPYLEKSKREFAFSNCKEILEDFLPSSFSSVSSCPLQLVELDERIYQGAVELERKSEIKKSIELLNLTKMKLIKKLEESGLSPEEHALLVHTNEQEGRLYRSLRDFSRVEPLSSILKANIDRIIESERASYSDMEEFLKFAKFLMTIQSTVLVMQKSHLSSLIETLESNFNILSEGLPTILGLPCSFELGGYLTTKFLEEVEMICSEAAEIGVDCSLVEFEDAAEIEEIPEDLFGKIARFNKRIEHEMFQGDTVEQMRKILMQFHQAALEIITERESKREGEISLLLEIEQYLKIQCSHPLLDHEMYIQTLSQVNEVLSSFLEEVRPKAATMEDIVNKVKKIKISLL